MEGLRSFTIEASKTTHLRVGIKWDPLERDDIADAYGIESLAEARADLVGVTKQIASTRFMSKLLRMSILFANAGIAMEKTLDQSLAKKKALEKYVSQGKLASYDLDLCCFCYDQNNRMVKYVTPVTLEKQDELQKEPAFMHTGDATTGTSGVFDEEILVNLSAIDPAIEKVFFVITSVNHDFRYIKGGFWNIVSTKDEDELLPTKIVTQAQVRVHVMARLSRFGNAWALDEIAEFCLVDKNEKISIDRRVNQMLKTRYLGVVEAAPPPAAPPAVSS